MSCSGVINFKHLIRWLYSSKWLKGRQSNNFPGKERDVSWMAMGTHQQHMYQLKIRVSGGNRTHAMRMGNGATGY